MDEPKPEFPEWFLTLRRSYRVGLPKTLDEVEDWLRVLDNAVSAEQACRALVAIRDLAHKLVGSSSSFEFNRLGGAARELESLAGSLVDPGAAASEADRRAVARLAAAVRREADAAEP